MRARPIHTVRASHSLGGVLVLRVNGISTAVYV